MCWVRLWMRWGRLIDWVNGGGFYLMLGFGGLSELEWWWCVYFC